MESQKLNVLIVGAHTRLGALIVKHTLAQPNLITNILIRDPKQSPELVDAVQKAGGRALFGNFFQLETLKDITKGMHTVVSAIYPVEMKIIVDGQIALIDDCIRNGVKRFVPSAFAGNIEGFPREELAELLSFEYYLKVMDHLQGKPIKTLQFWQGVFTESLFETFEAKIKDFGYWGNPEHKYDLTTYEDTAKVVAAAVADENRAGDVVIVGQSLVIKEIAEIYNRVRRVNVTPKQFGSLDDLKAKWVEARKANNESPETLLLGNLAYLFDDGGEFRANNNAEFPGVQWTTVEEVLTQNAELKLPS